MPDTFTGDSAAASRNAPSAPPTTPPGGDGSLRRRMWNGALTNYLRAAIRLLKTIFLTRILFFNLGEDYYGFWSLLWSVFGYILLFELGFGKTVQKYTAEVTATGDRGHFTRVVQAVLSSYLGIGAIIAGLSLAGAWFLPLFLKLPAGDHTYYQLTFLATGLGCAIVFPTGIIPEILAGLQRLHYRNWAIVLNQIFELAGIWLIFRLGGSLLAVAVFVTTNNLLANAIMLFCLKRLLPWLRLRPTSLNRAVLREIMSFSVFIYLMAMAKLVLLKTAPLILGSMLGMAMVALYQLGTRIPELMRLGTSQFQETLGPTAAMLHRAGRDAELQKLLLATQRFSVFLSLAALTVFLPLGPAILKVWLKVEDPTVTTITALMLFNALLFAAFRDTPREFLLMTGHHRLLAWTAAAECVLNLGLSIFLTSRMGVVGVAHGALWSNAAIALCVFLPATVRYAGFTFWRYLLQLYLPAGLTALAVLLPGWLLVNRLPLQNWTLPRLVLAMAALGGACLAIAWFTCLQEPERRKILALAGKAAGRG